MTVDDPIGPRRVHVIAGVEAPNRDWASTLPPSSPDTASWDRSFTYAWLRYPSRVGAESVKIAERLRPCHIVRVQDAEERARLEAQIPSFLKVLFIKARFPDA